MLMALCRCDETDVLAHTLDEALRLGRDVDRLSQVMGGRKAILERDIQYRLDSMLVNMLRDFPGTVTEGDISAVFVEHHDLTVAEMSKLGHGVIPLAIMRELVARNGLAVDRNHVPAWTLFSHRYRDAVV